jgi:hypothetical protein
MSLTNDPNDPGLKKTRPDGQQEAYLVLSEEERARGFVRPVRLSYRHVGRRPRYATRPLTEEEIATWGDTFVVFEPYPESEGKPGRYWTNAELSPRCGTVTTMARPLAETYARDPSFYGATFCAYCGAHFPVGAAGEFVWEGTDERVGT